MLETELSPYDLLSATYKIEISIGRTHKSTNGTYSDRLIDIDILFYDQLILNTAELLIPHPQIQNRLFVLTPLNEIAPDFIHPTLQKSVQELFLNLL